MRVIAGELRGRKLLAPQGTNTRPTADRTREALFHILSAMLTGGFKGLHVLDLFCGSGALSIEALSRGAQHATLIDSGEDALRCALANIQTLQLHERATVLQGTLPRALTARPASKPYSLVFADPPYALDPGPTLEALAPLCAPNALLCVEHGAATRPKAPKGWRLLQRRTWGQTTISFFQKLDDSQPRRPSETSDER